MNSLISRKTQKQMSVSWFPAAKFVPLKGTPTWRLHTKPCLPGKTFFRISRIWIIAQTWFLARLYVYLSDVSSFISLILDFLYWLVRFFIFDGIAVKTQEILGAHKFDADQHLGWHTWGKLKIGISSSLELKIHSNKQRTYHVHAEYSFS